MSLLQAIKIGVVCRRVFHPIFRTYELRGLNPKNDWPDGQAIEIFDFGEGYFELSNRASVQEEDHSDEVVVDGGVRKTKRLSFKIATETLEPFRQKQTNRQITLTWSRGAIEK